MNKLVIAVFILAVLLRLSGIFYGLPLRLIADEPQFIFSTLYMLQGGTLIPPFSDPEFSAILYNPPYLIYLFYIPFWILKDIASVINISFFFIAARIISIIAGIFALWLTYKTTKCLFSANKTAPFFALYFLSTSMLAIALSASARHWSFALLLGIAGLYILAQSHMSLRKRYFLTALFAGVGIGINQAIGALMAVFFLWYFIKEKGTIRKLISAGWFYAGTLFFAGLAYLPFLLYPQSLRGVLADELGQPFSVIGLLQAPFHFLRSLILSEPIFLLFAAIGLAFLLIKDRRLFLIFLGILIGYIYLFYFSYQFVHRYLAMLLPFFAVIAGYGAGTLWEKSFRSWKKYALVVLLILPLIISLQFARLLVKGDSRSSARTWFEEHIEPGSRVIVWSDLMRLTALPEAIQEKINFHPEMDPQDRREFNYPELSKHAFHALNLNNINDDIFYEHAKTYACLREYDYLIIEKSRFQSESHQNAMSVLAEHAELLASFGSQQERFAITGSFFGGIPSELFNVNQFGPPVFIYRLDREQLCTEENAAFRMIRDENDSVPKDAFIAIDLHNDKKRNLHIRFIADTDALVLLLEKSELEKMLARAPFQEYAHMQNGLSIVPIEKGDYVIIVASQGEDVHYSLQIYTDEFFLDE